MTGYVYLPGGGRLLAVRPSFKAVHHRASCRRLARYEVRDVIEVDVTGSTGCVVDGPTFPVRWCPECGVSTLRQAWRAMAVCADSMVDFFSFDRAEQAAARAICATCPVPIECANYALTIGARAGTWGGRSRAAE
jgi:hypothetical protein